MGLFHANAISTVQGIGLFIANAAFQQFMGLFHANAVFLLVMALCTAHATFLQFFGLFSTNAAYLQVLGFYVEHIWVDDNGLFNLGRFDVKFMPDIGPAAPHPKTLVFFPPNRAAA